MICDCGFMLPDNFNFCINCGKQLKGISEQSECTHEKSGLYFCAKCGKQLKHKPTPEEIAEQRAREERKELRRDTKILMWIITVLTIASTLGLCLKVVQLFL